MFYYVIPHSARTMFSSFLKSELILALAMNFDTHSFVHMNVKEFYLSFKLYAVFDLYDK